uniref:HAT C-terminal dimerisation domain-containing protein n=1 Tax=Oryzias latipes TaxID=8090 RepID=A0A3P9IF90_ORYLA
MITLQHSKMYIENYGKLMLNLKSDLTRWEILPLSLVGRIETVKMNVLPRLLYLFQALPIWIPSSTFKILNKMISTFVWQNKKPRIRKKLLCSSKRDGGLGLPNLRLYYWAAQLRGLAEWVMWYTSFYQDTLERHKAALACKRVRGRHTFDVIAAELEQIHSSFGLLNKVVATVTDNASNFVKAFKTFPPPESDEDEKEEEEEQKDVLFTDLAEALTSVSDEGHITLPPHYRCASHTINLISTSDVEKYLTSSPTTKSVYRVTIAKCTALWTKASRSTVAAEQVQEVSQRKLLVPSSTRWNSFYDAVSRVAEIPMNELNNLCNKLGIKCFNEKESLDILQGDECPYGALLPTLEILMMKSLSLKDLLTKMTADLPDVIVKVCMIQNHKKEVFPLLVNRINKLRIDLVTPVTGMEFFEFDSGGFELDTLSNFSAVKKVFLKYNTPTPSSAPVEHLFSLGGLVLTPRRNRLSDSRFEKLLLMRYNHCFTSPDHLKKSEQ